MIVTGTVGPRALLLAATGLLISGCLERKETISVARDGGVSFRLELTGDPGDFASGDALPETRTGWNTQDEFETDDDGNEKQKRIATREFAAGHSLPDCYVEPDDPQYGVAVMFPTTLTIERRRDGTYYHFKRVYHARAQARYEFWREAAKKKFEDLDKYLETDPDELSEEQRTRMIEILRTQEAAKQVEYVMAGAAALEDVWPQHFGLLLRQAFYDYFDNADLSPLIGLLGEPDSPDRNAAIADLCEELITGSREALRQKMAELHVPPDQVALFFAARDEEEARRAVTEDIEDDSWIVVVEMPGEIVAHNGELTDEKGSVAWAFGGKALFDRDNVLMVTSRVPNGDRHRREVGRSADRD